MIRFFVWFIAAVWMVSLAWLVGAIVGYSVVTHRERRRRNKIAAEHRRIAEDFGRWERDHIEWRRRISEGRHPSRWP